MPTPVAPASADRPPPRRPVTLREALLYETLLAMEKTGTINDAAKEMEDIRRRTDFLTAPPRPPATRP